MLFSFFSTAEKIQLNEKFVSFTCEWMKETSFTFSIFEIYWRFSWNGNIGFPENKKFTIDWIFTRQWKILYLKNRLSVITQSDFFLKVLRFQRGSVENYNFSQKSVKGESLNPQDPFSFSFELVARSYANSFLLFSRISDNLLFP